MQSINRIDSYFAPAPEPAKAQQAGAATAVNPELYLECLRELVRRAGGDPDFSFPMPLEEAIVILNMTGYAVPKISVENFFGESPVAVDDDDFRRFHKHLEKGHYYLPFPNPFRDGMKTYFELSREIAVWWERATEEDKATLLKNLTPC